MNPVIFLLLGIVLVGGAILALMRALDVTGVSHKAVRDRMQDPSVDTGQNPRTLTIADSERGPLHFLATFKQAAKIEQNLQLAGRPFGWTVAHVLVAKLVLSMSLAFVVWALIVAPAPSGLRLLVWVAAVVMGFFIPGIIISGRAKERQESIQMELPDILDQVTISIESGLGFEAALALTANSGEGPLAEEIVRTVQDIRLGMARREAYLALGERTTVDELRRFTRSIVQAEEYGVSVSGVVRTQAKEMRIKRRLRAEGKAIQVPTKMLFPMMICIFPVLFVVVLAPALLNAVATFSQ